MHPISWIFLGLCAFWLGFWLVRRWEQRGTRTTAITSTIAPSPLPGAIATPATASPQGLSLAIERDVRHLILENRKLEAIKLVRQRTGWSLKQAKEYVEQRQERRSSSSLDPQILAATKQLLAENQKIAAIQLIRNHTGWGLKEAKQYVENL